MTTDQITSVTCADCTMAIINCDYTGMDQDREKEVAKSVEALGKAYHVIIDTEEETIDVFSSAPCCCCGTRLAGYRFGATLYTR